MQVFRLCYIWLTYKVRSEEVESGDMLREMRLDYVKQYLFKGSLDILEVRISKTPRLKLIPQIYL